jgi:hypothetical protein
VRGPCSPGFTWQQPLARFRISSATSPCPQARLWSPGLSVAEPWVPRAWDAARMGATRELTAAWVEKVGTGTSIPIVETLRGHPKNLIGATGRGCASQRSGLLASSRALRLPASQHNLTRGCSYGRLLYCRRFRDESDRPDFRRVLGRNRTSTGIYSNEGNSSRKCRETMR